MEMTVKSREILIKSKNFIGQYIGLRSLRARLFFIILLVGMIPALMIRQGIMNSYEQRAIEQRSLIVQSQLKIIADHLINEHYMDNSNSTRINAELAMLSNIYDGRIQIVGENLNIIKDIQSFEFGHRFVKKLKLFFHQLIKFII